MDRGVSTLEVSLLAESAGWRFDRALAAAVPSLSRERLKVLISSGNVRRADGTALRDPSAKIVTGDVVVMVPLPVPDKAEAQDIALDVIFEDDHLLIVDKPAGLVVHPAAGNLDGTLVNALLHHCAGRLSGIGGVARPGIVHRIDKDTSGLLVVAKNDKTHEGLAKQFAAHTIDRRYLAISQGIPGDGSVDAPLARSPHDRKKVAIIRSGKRAVTHYRTLEALRDAALIECRLETGRTHQIRVHMASIGHALIGDPVYGGRSRAKLPLNFQRQALHATRLGFVHPVTSEAIAFDSPMPVDMQELFRALRV
ncbi:Ribosomal large subunit pseudouridine synthase D [Sphingomonas antarctica]|uniref:RluA family pseudouridine synthase n=1 Tax=Sphingomonas antarctica TaxID=2040274 RepID=UPI0039E75918